VAKEKTKNVIIVIVVGVMVNMMRFQVLTAASMRMTVFWDDAPCSLVEIHRRFRDAYCLRHPLKIRGQIKIYLHILNPLRDSDETWYVSLCQTSIAGYDFNSLQYVDVRQTSCSVREKLNRGGLRVCGALGQCSVRGPRALKNVVGCGCVLDALLFM
jgi:hypothetical protein